MNLPKFVAWFVPVFQASIACVVAWMISLGPSHTHGEPLTGSIVIDIVLFVLLFVQRGIMLRPDSA
jgi:hypothetical protein